MDSEEERDEALLDEAFDRAVERLRDGDEPDADELCAGRPKLRPRVLEAIRLARELAGAQELAPEVPGYELVRELGRGGMGVVYLARQARLGDRAVALKLLPDARLLGERARRRFLAEARALGRLRHPHVVAVHDVVEADGVLAYAMEWVEGLSLARLVGELRDLGRPPRIEDLRRALGAPADAALGGSYAGFVARVGLALAQALAAVHSAGLLHRDVKPSNVLLRRDGTALLADFGLAREEGEPTLTRTGAFAGTPAYASPEQLRGEGRALDARTDVYSLGATLYHLLALRLPHGGDSTPAVLASIERERAPRLARLVPRAPRELTTVIEHAMAADPAARYGTAAELAEDLERVLAHRPIRARPPGPWTRVRKLARRHRGAVVGGVLVGLVALAALLNVTVVERRVQDKLRAARTALLHPGFGELAWYARRGEEVPDAPLAEGLVSVRYPDALGHYDELLLWRPWHDEARRERRAVELALAEIEYRREAFRIAEPLLAKRRDALRIPEPLLADYLRRSHGVADVPELLGSELESASAAERRQLGLLAYLLADARTSLAAWEPILPPPGEDPLLDAAWAQILDLDNAREAEWARLVAASREFEEAGFLVTSLAHSAQRRAYPDDARQYLAAAREGASLQDPYGRLDAVEAERLARDGEVERAQARYLDYLARHRGTNARLFLAEMLATCGEVELAARTVHVPISYDWDTGEVEQRAIARAAARWYASVEPAALARQVALEAATPSDVRSAVPRLRWICERLARPLETHAERLSELRLAHELALFRAELVESLESSNPSLLVPSPVRREVAPERLAWTLALLDAADLMEKERVVIDRRMLEPLARLALAADAARGENLVSAEFKKGLMRRVALPLAALASGLLPEAHAQGLLFDLVGTTPGGELGAAIESLPDIDGDGVRELVVGEPDYSYASPGSVRVYSGAGGALPLWVVFGGQAGDALGGSLAVLDDLDGDGVPEIAAGAGQGGNGAAGYVRILSGSTGSLLCTLVGTAGGDVFGGVVARLGDQDGDGLAELAVGASQSIGQKKGYVRVFSLASCPPQLMREFIGPQNGSRYGAAVADIGDLDSDGLHDLCIGAPFANSTKGYVETVSTAVVDPLCVLSIPNYIGNYGYSVSALGDIDGGGSPDIAVGARWGRVRIYLGENMCVPQCQRVGTSDDQLGIRMGNASVQYGLLPVGAFEAPTGGTGFVELMDPETCSEVARLREGNPGDYFGSAMTWVGDLDGDGFEELAVGARRSDKGAPNGGRVYVYSLRYLRTR